MQKFADTAVLTIPISPPRKDKPGILSLCLTADILAKKLGAQSYLCMNIRDSYVDRLPLKEKFEESLRSIGMSDTRIHIDIDHQSHIAGNIRTLIEKGYIVKEKNNITSCSCGRIDCKSDFIEDLKGETQFHKNAEGDIICNSCESPCVTEEKETLVLKMPGTEKLPVTVPDYLYKEMETLRDKFAGQNIVISKKRETGYVFDYDGESFNIDVDFCTYNYLSSVPEKNKIVVGSSHVIYQMYMINLVETLCNPASDISFVPIAHISGDCELDIHDRTVDARTKQIYLASAFRTLKETSWPNGKLNYIRRQEPKIIDAVYTDLTKHARRLENEDWAHYLKHAVTQVMVKSNVNAIERKKENNYICLYCDEVDEFLNAFHITMKDIHAIWEKEKRFLPPDELIEYIARNGSEDVKNLARILINRNETTQAFVRMDFIIGLADTYAKHIDSTTALIEVDTINSNGAGKVLGSDRMMRIFGKVNEIFTETLKEAGAKTAFAIDHSKNDDYRIVVAGLAPDKLKKALAIAQQRIDDYFIFASDLPHSKYSDQWGIGAGYGSRLLGKNMKASDLDAMLFRECEYKKRDSSRYRKEVLAAYPEREPLHIDAIQMLTDVAVEQKQDNGFERKQEILALFRENADDITNRSEEDKTIINGFRALLTLPEASTGALRDCSLLHDIRHAATRSNGHATLVNIKMENSAGVNKTLTRAHSVSLTRDYVEGLKALTTDHARVYYIGRNSFNILFDRNLSREELDIFMEKIKEVTHQRINRKTVRDYFADLGLGLPNHLKTPDMKMGEIENTRGNFPGITTINFSALSCSPEISREELFNFQQNSINGFAYKTWEVQDKKIIFRAGQENQPPRIVILRQKAEMKLAF